MSHDYFEQAAQLSRARAEAMTPEQRERAAYDWRQKAYRLAERHEREKADRRERGLEPHSWPVNLLDELFGPYTCTICCSYGHPTSMHTGRG